ncbi:MAG: hypothetical protein ABJM06_13715 [Gilvibacter sp.]
MRLTFFLLMIAFLTLSCGQKKADTQEETLMRQTVTIHDDLMMQMGKLTTLEASLKEASVDSATANFEKLKMVQAANKEMFDWMREFGDAFTHEQINKNHELSADEAKLLQEYYDRIALLQSDIDALLKPEE